MEKLTLHQSTILGTVQGRRVMATVRPSQSGLLLPAGRYVLHAPVHNPVYGEVMGIEPVQTPDAPATRMNKAVEAPNVAPAAHKTYAPAAHKATAPGAVKFTSPAIKFDSPAIKFDSPAIKYDSPAIKFDSPAIKFDSPAIKFDSGAGGAPQPVLITSRPIAGNSLYVTSGLADLFDAVRMAGGVILVVD
jgi:hypothetical protein